MEISMAVSLWQLLAVVISVAAAFATNTFMTKQNSHKIKVLEEKCAQMMEEILARETFVSMELYKSEVRHVHRMLDELKEHNQVVLELMRKEQK